MFKILSFENNSVQQNKHIVYVFEVIKSLLFD